MRRSRSRRTGARATHTASTRCGPACPLGTQVKDFQPYADDLARLAQQVEAGHLADPQTTIAVNHALDGEATIYLRKSVNLAELRANGAFFTSSSLAQKAWDLITSTIGSDSIILDPTCGAGNLLLPAIPYLAKTATDTSDLSSRICGVDLSSSFVDAARTRVALSAMQLTAGDKRFGDLGVQSFSKFMSADLLQIDTNSIYEATHIALNPPYVMRPNPAWCDWTSGSVNSAAVFLAYCLESMQPGARMVAILPDVLRSGTRYHRWREHVETLADVQDIVPFGQFDTLTDIHVFVLYLSKRDRSSTTHESSQLLTQIGIAPTDRQSQDLVDSWTDVGARFKVSVGTVVQHRHPEVGCLRRFAHAKGLEPWIEVSELPTRRFTGRCERPPFVVVRRTSRPGEPHRARPTIISGSMPVAVDNHLIVLSPVDGSLDSCKDLVRVLRQPESSGWLDEHFRCRHLTVGSLRRLPWLETEGETGRQ